MQLFELNPAESIFAPFHDNQISAQIPLTVTPSAAINFRRDIFWDSTKARWDDCTAGAIAGTFTLPLVPLSARFDRYVFCVVVPVDVSVEFFACRSGEWSSLGAGVRGNSSRLEITLPVGAPATAVRAAFTAMQPGAQMVSLQWWGVSDSTLLERLEKARPAYDAAWEGLILPEAEWPDLKFARGLLFAEGDLPGLKARAASATWAGHFKIIEERARQSLARQPEKEIGDYLPWSDYRYLREREQGLDPWMAEPVLCALVGLVREDRAMMRHALRFLMSFVHTKHWCQSAESRARGSTWDQRCFLEEMAVTTCALVFDWLYFALTERARDLVRVAIWDKGLSILQRDMVKWEYVYTINQGPWFCRARILGGLVLEPAWPRAKSYVEQAHADMQEGMANYILPDGGVDEGVGYFSVTLHAVLSGLLAYARARDIPIAKVLPPRLVHSGHFVAVMSAMSPGGVLLDGDNSNDRFTGDAIALLAAFYPQDVYAKIALGTLLQMRGNTYYRQYMVDGPFAFIAGPAELPAPECIVPTFGVLPHTGQLTSRREIAPGRNVRLHLSGCKARASHTHFDKGAFILELDELPVLIDRGMIRYDDIRGFGLKLTHLHNVLAPETAEGAPVGQPLPEVPIIPAGEGDELRLRARINLGPVWAQVMERCEREIASDAPEQFTVHDRGMLRTPHALVFHLHTRERWVIDAAQRTATLDIPGWRLTLHAPWAEEIRQREDSIDHRLEPVWHLECRRPPEANAFDLATRFTIALR